MELINPEISSFIMTHAKYRAATEYPAFVYTGKTPTMELPRLLPEGFCEVDAPNPKERLWVNEKYLASVLMGERGFEIRAFSSKEAYEKHAQKGSLSALSAL